MLAIAAVGAILLPGALFAQAPANDECTGATVIPSLPYTNSQDTRLATPNPTDPVLLCADSGGGKTVWYTYTADSTHYVTFTTALSSPSTYDIAMGLFTGSCGSLVQVDCNDDINPGTIRQAEITHLVTAGTTYIIHIGEWKGGGPSGGVPTGGDLVFQVFNAPPPPPIVKGPKSGSVPSGGIVSTGPLGVIEMGTPVVREEEDEDNRPDQPLLPTPADVMPPKAPAGSNYKDLRSPSALTSPASKPVILKQFQGFVGGGFPPDPIMAVGPNHVIAVENSVFRIWDKNGTILKTISGDTWFTNVAGAGNYAGDPQVLYDQFSHRWVMAGFTGSTPNELLISVSDDDDPIGTWYNWALPEGLGDSTTGWFADYPQMGYDENAIYITTREFGASFQYSRVRIIPKAQLYANTAGPVAWKDFWDFREPDHPNARLDGIRPSAMFTPAGVHFLVNASPYSLGTFFSVWTIHDPIGTPSITGVNVPVVQYSSASNAGEPGTTVNLIEAGGSVIRHKAVYRDSSLWVAHSIASGSGGLYSSVHYVRLNPFTNTNLEDVAAGVDGFWHYYPALMVDANKNVIITSTRSGLTEYPSAYVAGHRSADPPGLSDDVLMRPGLGHWDPFLPGSRNRWGDYMGAGLDPVDTTAIWFHTQYTVGTDAYATWVAMTKMAPVPGKFIFADKSSLNFGPSEVSVVSAPKVVTLTNNGLDTLTVTSITLPDSHFVLLSPPTLPLKIATFETVDLNIAIDPARLGAISDSIAIASDDTLNPTTFVKVDGNGFVVTAALTGTLYASSGASDGGRLLSVNTNTAAATGIGGSGYTQIINLRVRPSTNELMGLATNLAGPAGAYDIVRINSAAGDAHPVSSLVLSLVKGMAFHGDTMYVARINGAIYRVDIATGTPTLVANTGLSISGMDFHPVTGQLWVSVRSGVHVDGIYKVSLPSGSTTYVGSTGFGVQTVDITFDNNGNLFGLIGNAPTTNDLLLIDTTSGVGSLIGSMGIASGQGLALRPGTGFSTNTYHMLAKWNMVSVPLDVPDFRTSVVFPTAVSNAYGYAGDFTQADTLHFGEGYWLKFGSQAVLAIIGTPVLDDTIPVRAKWNMIGSASQPVPVTMLAPIPPGNILTNYYGYGDSGYSVADTIYPGRGYWVKANAAGSLAFGTLAAAGKAPSPVAVRDFLSTLHSVTIGDGSGQSQMLYFGKEGDAGIARDQFALPPAPPAGIFDARFASQSMVALHAAAVTDAVEFPLSVSSATSPVKLSWNVTGDPELTYTAVVRMKGGPSVSTYVMRGTGEATLGSGEVVDMRIHVTPSRVPTSYALHQNYPNPFNPQTTIKYDLPEVAHVTLVVYDLLGREVATLVNQRQEAGYYTIPFMAENLSSGVYFYQLIAGDFTQIQKMLLVR